MGKTLTDVNNQWEVLHADGTTIELNSRANVSCVTKAEQTCELGSGDIVTLTVLAANPINFKLGDRFVIFGQTYKLNQLPQVKKTGSKAFEYTLAFEGVQYELIDKTWLLPDDTVRDSYTGDLAAFMAILADNANRNSEVTWSVGECPTGTEYKTLTYSDKNCLEVLQALCEEYGLEFSITQTTTTRVIDLKAKVGETLSYTFKYGRNGGAYSIERTNNDSSNVVTRLYAYGSTENLGSKYRHTRLCLPNKAKNQSYVEDADKTALYGSREAFKTFDDIRPERVGTVSGVSSSDPMTFYDKDMFELTASENDSTKYLIDGTTAKVTFQTGDLAGYEFEIASYIHKDKRFILSQFEDENGYQFPSSTFKPKVGDTYVLSDIVLPQTYIDTAEAKLLTKANEQLAETSEPNVTYAVQLDETFLSEMVADGTANIFRVGDSVKITDADLGIDANIRIQSFTRDCINPYKYNLTLSDTSTPTTLQRVVGSIDRTSQAVEVQSKINAKEARLRYQAMEELKGLVFDPEGNYYSDKIAPLSIDTTMLTVGSRSQQLSVSGILFSPNAWDGTTENPNVLKITTAGAGVLTHYTIADTPRSWSLSSITFTGLTSTSAYYIYAKCNQAAGDTGAVLMVDTAQRTVDSDPSGQVWYFLLGTLSSVIDGLRVINLTYGQTTVNGSFITTGVISSIDGGTTFNLNTGEIKGNISFSASSTTDENRRWVDSLIGYSTDKSAMQVDISNAQSTANSALTNSSTALSTANSAKSKVDNMKVGGRNLCLGTGTAKSWSSSTSGNVGTAPYKASAYIVAQGLKNGDEVTVSFDMTSSVAATIGGDMWINVSGSAYRHVGYAPKNLAFTAGETKHIAVACTLNHNGWNTALATGDVWGWGTQATDVTTTFTISNFKVELGNVATDWTPAPEDVDAAITAAKKAAIEGVDVMYALGTSSTTAPTSGWSTTAPAWEKGKYMWQRTDIKTGDGTTKAGEATCIQGAAGENGESGVGITGYKEWYYLSTSSTSCSGGTWQETQPTWSAGKYVWTQTEVFYDNGTTSHTDPLLSNLFNVANQAAKDASDAAELANTTANSALTNSSTALTTANSAKSKVDNMRVGGRNLCRGTGTAKSGTYTSNSINISLGSVTQYLADVQVKAGDSMTVSFDIKSSAAVTITGVYPSIRGSKWRTLCNGGGLPAFTAGETKHMSFTGTAGTIDATNWETPIVATDVWYLNFSLNENVATTFTISNFKVELGNVATDWTPAPEDVDSDINAANEKIAQAMSLAATAGNLFNDQFLLSNCTANAPEPPTGLARLCNNRNNYFGTAFSVEPSMKVTVEMIIRRHDDDATDLTPEIGLWYWSSDGTTSWQHVAYSELGAASMDGMWYRVRSTFTITGADLATAKRPQTAKVYVWMDKTASTGDGVNSAGAFWVSNIVVLCTQYDYLEDALKETSSTTTEVQGGLVLGKMIAMRNTINGSEAWVAGLNGCSQCLGDGTLDNDGDLPMIWAGSSSNTNAGLQNARFRVYDNGKVYMSAANISSGTDGSIGLNLVNGNISMGTLDNGTVTTPLTQIINTSYNTNAAALADRNASGPTKTSTQYTISPLMFGGGKSEAAPKGIFKKSGSEKELLFTVDSKMPAGKVTFAISELTLTVSGTGYAEGTGTLNDEGTYTHSYIGSIEALATIMIYINGIAKATIATARQSVNGATWKTFEAFGSTTIVASATASTFTNSITLNYSPGDIVTVGCEAQISYNSLPAKGLTTSYISEGSCTASVTLSCSSVASCYNNLIYANGILLSTASNKYIAMNPKDNVMFKMVNGVNALEFANGGGLYLSRDSGNSWYRGNPLVLVLKMTGDSSVSTQGCIAVFNPFGKSNVTITRTGTGCYTVNHNLGNINHTLIAQGHGLDNGCLYVSIISVGKNADTIKTSDDDTCNDADVLYISFFDYNTYQ